MALETDAGVAELIALARREDLGAGDVSTSLIVDPGQMAVLRLIAKQRGVFAGREIALAVLQAYDESIELDWQAGGRDGAAIDRVPMELAMVRGPIGPILSAERVLLNFLQRLCGAATLTSRYVQTIAGTGAAIYDTRKTLPGWRQLDKYAVRCGGGRNHRFGLYDAVLIKDNHVAGVEPRRLASAVFEMLNRLSAGAHRSMWVEVEAATLPQVEELLKVVGIHAILLDNFQPADLRRAVELRDDRGLLGKVDLEASGGINLDNVRAIAETGVERISIGAITHSALGIDLSMERA